MRDLAGLQCVCCNSVSLRQIGTSISCDECGVSYPIIHNVPIFFSDVIIQPTEQLPAQEFAQQIADAFSLPAETSIISTIQDIFSKDYKFGDFLIDVESRQFIDRVRNSGNFLLDQLSPEHKTVDEQNIWPVNVSHLVSYKWLLDYLPQQI